MRKYNKADFKITQIHCDGEYKPLMNKIKDELNIDINFANPQDHVPEAEHNNRMIKERVRAAYQRLPYTKLPKTMVKYLAMVQTHQLNYFPVKGGISDTYSPRMIMGDPPIDYKKHCSISFGAYVQANHEHFPKNDQTAHTLDCIYLRPCNNLQGGHELMDLNSGHIITR